MTTQSISERLGKVITEDWLFWKDPDLGMAENDFIRHACGDISYLLSRIKKLEEVVSWFVDEVDRDERHGNKHPGIYDDIYELAKKALNES